MLKVWLWSEGTGLKSILRNCTLSCFCLSSRPVLWVFSLAFKTFQNGIQPEKMSCNKIVFKIPKWGGNKTPSLSIEYSYLITFEDQKSLFNHQQVTVWFHVSRQHLDSEEWTPVRAQHSVLKRIEFCYCWCNKGKGAVGESTKLYVSLCRKRIDIKWKANRSSSPIWVKI